MNEVSTGLSLARAGIDPAEGRRALGFVRDPGVQAVLVAFVLSRLLTFAILIVAVGTKSAPESSFPGHTESTVSINPARMAEIVRSEVLTADVNWYVGLAEQGYHRGPFDSAVPHNWAFFPVFPLLLRAIAAVTREYVLTGVALSNVCLLAALFLLHRLCRLFTLSEADAERCVFYAAFFPVSYFFSLPMTESLFLLISVASFHAAKRGHWWLAGIAGGIASATRVTGILLLPALALLFLQLHGRNWRRKELLSVCLVPVGLVCFMFYLHQITGNAFAFKDVLVAWGREPGFFLDPFIDYLRDPFLLVSAWDLRVVNFAAAVTALASGVVLFVRREFGLASYAILCPLLTLSSGLLQSQARYALVVFPLFMVLAIAGRTEAVDRTVRVVFIALLTILTAMYAGHQVAALS